MLTLRIQNLCDPWDEIRRGLRAQYPRAEVLRVGAGYRRSGASQSLRPQLALKVQLRRKLSPVRLSRREFLPRTIRVVGAVIGARFEARIPVDVVGVPSAQTSTHRITTDVPRIGVVASYARWKIGGTRYLGVVTCGHVLRAGPGSAPVERVRVSLIPACDSHPDAVDGVVVCASDVWTEGIDVGLVRLPGLGELIQCGCVRAFARNVAIPSGADLLSALSDNPNDVAALGGRMPTPNDSLGVNSVAYYPNGHDMSIDGWPVTMRSAVESSAPDLNAFAPGCSGAGLVSSPAPRRAVAIQSCADATNGYRTGWGTSFSRSAEWLASQLGAPVELTWDPADLL